MISGKDNVIHRYIIRNCNGNIVERPSQLIRDLKISNDKNHNTGPEENVDKNSIN